MASIPSNFFFFLYGDLAKPHVVQKALDLPNRPNTTPAMVLGSNHLMATTKPGAGERRDHAMLPHRNGYEYRNIRPIHGVLISLPIDSAEQVRKFKELLTKHCGPQFGMGVCTIFARSFAKLQSGMTPVWQSDLDQLDIPFNREYAPLPKIAYSQTSKGQGAPLETLSKHFRASASLPDDAKRTLENAPMAPLPLPLLVVPTVSSRFGMLLEMMGIPKEEASSYDSATTIDEYELKIWGSYIGLVPGGGSRLSGRLVTGEVPIQRYMDWSGPLQTLQTCQVQRKGQSETELALVLAWKHFPEGPLDDVVNLRPEEEAKFMAWINKGREENHLPPLTHFDAREICDV